MKYSKEDHFKVERTEKRGNRNVRIGKFYCILNDKTYNTLGGLRNAVKPHMTMKDFYIKYYASDEDFDVCVVCGKNHRIFIDVVEGFREYCSNTCSLKMESHRTAVANRFVGDPDKKQQALAKRKQTYDNKSLDELNAIEKKRMNTLLANHGIDYYSEKAKKQWQRRTAEDVQAFFLKRRRTLLQRDKVGYNFYAAANKRLTLNGVEYFCQGYEDAVLKFLIEEMHFSTDDVVNGYNVPKIPYEGNVSKKYHPDIFIKSMNLILEVKSDFTIKKEYENSKFAKQLATIDEGYNHVYIALNNVTKTREMTSFDKETVLNFLNMMISSQAQLIETVQRPSLDGEYRAIAIGSGSAKVPHV